MLRWLVAFLASFAAPVSPFVVCSGGHEKQLPWLNVFIGDADTKPIPTKTSSTDFAAGTSQLPLMLLRGSQFWQFCPSILWSNQQDLPRVREVFEIAKEFTTVKLRHLPF